MPSFGKGACPKESRGKQNGFIKLWDSATDIQRSSWTAPRILLCHLCGRQEKLTMTKNRQTMVHNSEKATAENLCGDDVARGVSVDSGTAVNKSAATF